VCELCYIKAELTNQLWGHSVAKAQEALIARRYAKAFYELAADRKKIDVVAKDMTDLSEMSEFPAFRSFLKNPLIKRSEQLAAIEAIAKKAKLDKTTQDFLATIARNGRLPALPYIVKAVRTQISEGRGEVKAEITSARSLSSAQLKKLTESLKKTTGTEIDITVKIDESIMGGLIIKLGSLMIDQSVKTRLDRLERALKSTTVADAAEPMREVA
jgi:F-type H+-transporting ATPase subunit delta